MTWPGLTWSCHVCHEERPDEAISVFKQEAESKGIARLSVNVRYCNDRPACVDGAPAVAAKWLGHAGVHPEPEPSAKWLARPRVALAITVALIVLMVAYRILSP